MLDVRYSTKFKKDFRICVKRRYNMAILQQVIDVLRIPAALPPKNVDHNLSGNYTGYRECHIAPDYVIREADQRNADILADVFLKKA